MTRGTKICKTRSNGKTARVTWIGREEAYPKIAKLGQLGTGSGSRDLLLNFGTPSISEERLKIKTLNLVRR